MTDARLLATNPENSSLVPVACNAQGQLIVQDVQIEGIDNDVTVNGELTVTGGADFTGDVQIAGDANEGEEGCRMRAFGQISACASGRNVWAGFSKGSKVATSIILSDGSAEFANGNFRVGVQGGFSSYRNNPEDPGKGEGLNLVQFLSNFYSLKGQVFRININGDVISEGGAEFAGGKAGFTAEGHLWCTTRRGDTVILDATSNGLASWADYTPPSTRRDVLEEKLTEWSEKDKSDQVSPEDGDET